MTVILAQGLTKSYGTTRALDGLDLRVQAGEIHGFIGMNGAGKSTTIRILLGMLHKDGGEITLFGADPFKDAPALHRRLAYVPSEVNPWANLTGGEVIDLFSRMRGPVDAARRSQLIERFQFDPAKKCRTYSKGNRQKVALISALVSQVELYVLDEPTSGLDPMMEIVFQQVVRELAEQGSTVFLSSHILSEVSELCNEISVIRDGRIVRSGSMNALREFSRLQIDVTTATPIPDEQKSQLEAFRGEGNHATFYVESVSLNAVMVMLASLGIVSLQCQPPKLEDLFLRYYGKEGDFA